MCTYFPLTSPLAHHTTFPERIQDSTEKQRVPVPVQKLPWLRSKDRLSGRAGLGPMNTDTACKAESWRGPHTPTFTHPARFFNNTLCLGFCDLKSSIFHRWYVVGIQAKSMLFPLASWHRRDVPINTPSFVFYKSITFLPLSSFSKNKITSSRLLFRSCLRGDQFCPVK